MSLPLEDAVADIIGKAQRGLKLTDDELVTRTGISPSDLQSAQSGEGNVEVLGKIASALGLNAKALIGLPSYLPAPVQVRGLAPFSTTWTDMVVNSYLVWDSATGDAVAFDTGADCEGMLELVRAQGLKLRLILLTHTHGDHVFDLDRLREKTKAKAYVSNREPFDGAESYEVGRDFQCGSLRISSRQTSGHSPGGTTYFIEGLERPVAIVGDALFAGSMGGANHSYAEALDSNRAQIFSLPPETVLCPGHGPLTTVSEELAHNPFFAH